MTDIAVDGTIAPRQPRRAVPATRSTSLLAASGVLFALLIVCAAALLSRHLYRLDLRSNERTLSSLSVVLADQADRATQAIELVQQSIVDEIRTDAIQDEPRFVARMSTSAIHQSLRDRIAALPQASAIVIVDRLGRIVNVSARGAIPDGSVAEQTYFKTMADDPNVDHYLTRPVRTRGGDGWTVYIARRVTAPDGSFLGLILGAIELDYFERLYAHISPAKDYAFTILRNDGLLLVRYPQRPGTVGVNFIPAGRAELFRRDGPFGTVRVRSAIDGQDRLISVHPLGRFDARLAVSRATAAALAPWRHQTLALVGAALLLILGLLSIVSLGVRQLRVQRRLAQAEERERSERLLREEHARFARALDNMTQGLFMFDGEGRLTMCNGPMPAILGLDERPATGSGPVGILRRMIAGGSLRRADAKSALDKLRRLSAQHSSVRFSRVLRDGRTLAFHASPLDDRGWLLTCEDITDRTRAEARVAFLAHHDALTGLPNRVLFGERLACAMPPTDQGRPCSVLCIDLDGFKEVNDTRGHAVGDRILQEVAVRLGRCMPGGITAARIGGDEFAVILPRADGVMAAAIAARLLDTLRLPFDLDGCRTLISAGIGIASAPGDGRDADTLLRHGDIALYAAKAEGHGRVRRFAAGMNEALVRRRQTQTELRAALECGQFDLHYQPIVRLGSRAVAGFEALLRWHHPERGLTAPDGFVSVAEESGLIVPIGTWVLATACAAAASWREELFVAVNLSPLQVHDQGLVDTVRGVLASSGLPPKRLELEITETVLLQDDAGTLDTLTRLKALGVSIALDDFGTGYSSLGYLRRFPFDKVKIDRSFVHDLGRRHEADAIVRAIIGLSAELGMTSLAEGVETEEQFARLAAEGCIDAQGYLFSPPLPSCGLDGMIGRSGIGRADGRRHQEGMPPERPTAVVAAQR